VRDVPLDVSSVVFRIVNKVIEQTMDFFELHWVEALKAGFLEIQLKIFALAFRLLAIVHACESKILRHHSSLV